MTDAEIIELLGGPTAVARMLNIKPPSVMGWLETGIPEGRLRDLAAQIEFRSNGRFTRRKRWPENYAFFWPELAERRTARTRSSDGFPDTVHGEFLPEAPAAVREPPHSKVLALPPTLDVSDIDLIERRVGLPDRRCSEGGCPPPERRGLKLEPVAAINAPITGV